jgi:hypothetical protein
MGDKFRDIGEKAGDMGEDSEDIVHMEVASYGKDSA